MVGVDIPGKVGLVDHDPDKAEFELVEAGQDGRAARDCFWRRLVARYQTLKNDSTLVFILDITCAHYFSKAFKIGSSLFPIGQIGEINFSICINMSTLSYQHRCSRCHKYIRSNSWMFIKYYDSNWNVILTTLKGLGHFGAEIWASRSL